MLWKEVLAPRTPAFYGTLGLVTTLMLGVLLAWSTYDYAAPAFRELAQVGYGVAPSGSARGLFHVYLRIAGTLISLVVVLGIASDAGAGIAGERENDTWISLIATPLNGLEIVRAKMLGAIWGIRHTAGVLIFLWFLGVLAGAVHPLGFVASLVEMAAFTWFAAALGIWFSLRSEQTLQAVARVTGLLVVLNAGALLGAATLCPGRPLALFGCAPLVLCASLVSYGELGGTLTRSVLGPFSDLPLSALWVKHGAELAVACGLGTIGYGVAAYLLTRSACHGFDALLDRPEVVGSDWERGVVRRPARPHASRAADSGLYHPVRRPDGRRNEAPRAEESGLG